MNLLFTRFSKSSTFILFLIIILPVLTIAQEAKSKKPALFQFYVYSFGNKPNNAFVPLSDLMINDSFRGRLIPQDWLYDPDDKKQTLRELPKTNRSTILTAVDIPETDSLFIYRLKSGTINRSRISKLSMVAMVSIYSPDGDVDEFEYMFGLRPDDSTVNALLRNKEPVLVSIGQECPFVAGKSQAIEWEPTDSFAFPNIAPKAEIKEEYRPKSHFKFKTDSLHYFARVYNNGKWIIGVQVVVQTSGGKTVFNHFFRNTESLSPAPLYREKGQHFQYTGTIFKDLPPIMYGFEWATFGCTSVHFLRGADPIWIRCDNRH